MNAKNKTIRFSDKLSIWYYDENNIISDKNIRSSTAKDNIYENKKNKFEISYQRIVLWMILLVIILTIARR